MYKSDPNGPFARSSSMKPRMWLALAVGLVTGMAADVASANGLQGTPFESGVNADALAKLSEGATVKRSSMDNTLTPDDRARLNAIGLPRTHAAAVVLHKIKRTDAARQMARLTTL